MPDSFEEQAEIIWGHIKALLRAADMTVANLVSLRFYLADPKYDEANVRILARHLGTACAVADGNLLSATGPALEARGRSHGGDLIGWRPCAETSKRCSTSRRRRRKKKSARRRCSSSAS
jgi:hypothetical protein